MDFVGRLALGLYLRGGNVSKFGLLLVDLLAYSVDECRASSLRPVWRAGVTASRSKRIALDLRFEAVPLGFQLFLRARGFNKRFLSRERSDPGAVPALPGKSKFRIGAPVPPMATP